MSITQCPHCQTRFRVAPFQLMAARGLARCGACLAIFNARHHRSSTSEHHQSRELPAVAAAFGAPLETPVTPGVNVSSLNDSLTVAPEPPVSAAPELKLQEPPQPVLKAEHPPLLLRPAAEVFADSEAEPHWQWQSRRPTTSWTWPALILGVGIVGLSGLYTSLHFDELARWEEARPWLNKVCAVVGCQVPLQTDLSQIKSTNLVVQTHPDFKGALLVEAILYNRAPFSQPFPILELNFTDVNGWPLANRRFKPAEYLGDDPERAAGMPPQTPIHISMEVLDPGENAVSYTLSFQPAE